MDEDQVARDGKGPTPFPLDDPLLGNLVEHINVGFLLADPADDLRVVYRNRWLDLLLGTEKGRPREELYLLDVVSHSYHGEVARKVNEGIRDQAMGDLEELGLVSLDGREVPVVGSILPMDIGGSTLVAGWFHDVSARHRAELDARRQADRADFYIDLMSHDLLNLLQGAVLNLDWVAGHAEVPDELRGRITSAVGFLRSITELIVTVRRVSAREGEGEGSSVVDLASLLRDTAKAVADIVPGSDSRFELELPRGPAFVVGGPLLEEALFNVLMIAQRGPDERSGNIRVNLSPSDGGGNWRLEVMAEVGEEAAPGQAAHRWGGGIGLAARNLERLGGRLFVEGGRSTGGPGRRCVLMVPALP